MTVTKTLAHFAAETEASTVSENAVQMVQFSMLDWFAVGLAGRAEPVSRVTRDMVVAEAGTAEASVFGTKVKLPARAAALSNGTTSHALDYDDTHFAHIGHPSVAVMSAALAVAEAQNADGRALQHAALLGIEASIRLGVWLGRNHYQSGFHQTGTAGAFGAGLAAARLMGLNAQQCEMVIGLLATRASGLKSQFGTMGKPYNAGLAAANGVEAAQLVARGFIANPTALESDQGFAATHAGEYINDGLQSIGTEWLLEGISHKFHACCHGLHAALEAIETSKSFETDKITKIDVSTHPRWMSVCNQLAPMTGLGAKFSYRTVIPMSLLGYDTANLDSYSETTCKDPALQKLRALIHVEQDESLTEMQARLRVVVGNEPHEAFHDLNAPLSLEERANRLLKKSISLIGESDTHLLASKINNFTDAFELGQVLQG